MFVILGASGSGKSSFLRAGLWSRVKRDDLAWLSLPIVRPERAALSGKYGLSESLFEIISEPRFAEGIRQRDLPRSRVDIQDFVEKTDDGVAKLLAAVRDIAQAVSSGENAAPPTTLLAIDQGEELFNEEGRDEAKRFIDILTKTLTADSRTMAILVMRSDAFPLGRLWSGWSLPWAWQSRAGNTLRRPTQLPEPNPICARRKSYNRASWPIGLGKSETRATSQRRCCWRSRLFRTPTPRMHDHMSRKVNCSLTLPSAHCPSGSSWAMTTRSRAQRLVAMLSASSPPLRTGRRVCGTSRPASRSVSPSMGTKKR